MSLKQNQGTRELKRAMESNLLPSAANQIKSSQLYDCVAPVSTQVLKENQLALWVIGKLVLSFPPHLIFIQKLPLFCACPA